MRDLDPVGIEHGDLAQHAQVARIVGWQRFALDFFWRVLMAADPFGRRLSTRSA
jgi:hypothetical protein